MKSKITSLSFLLAGLFSLFNCADLPCRVKTNNPTVNVSLHRSNSSDTIKAYIDSIYAKKELFEPLNKPVRGSNLIALSLDPFNNNTVFEIIIDSLTTPYLDTVPEYTSFRQITKVEFPFPDSLDIDSITLIVDTLSFQIFDIMKIDSVLSDINNTIYPITDSTLIDTLFYVFKDSLEITGEKEVIKDSVFLKNITENLTVYHTNSQELYSEECGFVNKYQIDSINTGNGQIDSIYILENDVQFLRINDIEENIIHIKLFF